MKKRREEKIDGTNQMVIPTFQKVMFKIACIYQDKGSPKTYPKATEERLLSSSKRMRSMFEEF